MAINHVRSVTGSLGSRRVFTGVFLAVGVTGGHHIMGRVDYADVRHMPDEDLDADQPDILMAIYRNSSTTTDNPTDGTVVPGKIFVTGAPDGQLIEIRAIGL